MNVLLLTFSYLPAAGGVQRVVSTLAHGLAARGHAALVVTHAPVRFFRFERGELPVLRLRMPPQCEPDVRARLATTLRNAFNLAVLVPFAWRFRVDLVSCHFVNMDTFYARALSRLLRVPYVLTLHGSDVMRWGRHDALRTRYFTAMLRAAERVTAVGRALIDEAERYLPGVGDKACAIPNGVDVAGLRALADRPAEPGPPYVLFVGRLSDEKEVRCLVEAFHRIAGAHPDFAYELRVVGDGACAAALRAQAEAGAAATRIRFLGAKRHPEALALMRSAALLVLPSRHEGCSIVLLEAMALGTPVLASDIPAVREVLEPGVTGSTFAVGDAQALAERIVELCAEPARTAALAARAREHVARAHSLDVTIDAYVEVFAATCRSAAAQVRTAGT